MPEEVAGRSRPAHRSEPVESAVARGRPGAEALGAASRLLSAKAGTAFPGDEASGTAEPGEAFAEA